jgi:hypothetical protein
VMLGAVTDKVHKRRRCTRREAASADLWLPNEAARQVA